MQASKAVRLLSLLPSRPVEFFDRVITMVEVNRERGHAGSSLSTTSNVRDMLTRALEVPSEDIEEILAEAELREIEEEVRERIAKLEQVGPFDSGHNGDFSLAKSIYVTCRLLSPHVVVETGVAYGVTSAFILQALAVNRAGLLFSIDLPPLGKNADQNVGAFVPQELKDRWKLHRGPVKRVLPQLLLEIGEVDLFVHDSLHTYRHMTLEFELIWPSLRPPALVIADDVGLNDAFCNFAAKVKPTFSAVVKEEKKDAQFGVLVKRA